MVKQGHLIRIWEEDFKRLVEWRKLTKKRIPLLIHEALNNYEALDLVPLEEQEKIKEKVEEEVEKDFEEVEKDGHGKEYNIEDVRESGIEIESEGVEREQNDDRNILVKEKIRVVVL